MHDGWKQTLVSIAVGFSSLLLLSCGGGGGGDAGGGAPPAAQTTTVSGSVQAPGGQVAFNQPQGLLQQFAQFISPSAYASVSGLSPVPDGTTVQLVRLNATGTSFTVLASTTTSGGRYTFNLTNLGIQPSNDLVVRVANGAVEMRAFVTSSNVDLDPLSETAVRLVLQQLGGITGATLTNFTVQELADITGSIDVLATAKQLAAGTNIENTVTTIQNAVAANAGLMAFIVAAGGTGQTTQGPGDVGNHISFTQGNQLQFQGTETQTGTSTVSFENSVKITGTKVIAGVTTTIFSESNPDNSGTATDEYRVKDTTGISNRGNNDVTDFLTPQLVPFTELRFPLQPGTAFQPFNKQGLNFGDADKDGKNDTAAINAQVKVVGFENVTVTAGTFPNTVRVETTVNLAVTLSSDKSTISVTETQTRWFASGVGPVKQTSVTQSQGITDTIVEELVSYSVDGQGTNVQTLNLVTKDILYDPFKQVIYASVPSSSQSNPNTIAIIDPMTGTITASVPTGTDPDKLALSDDGQFLYVGLNGSASVARYAVATMTLEQTFSLGTFAIGGIADDIQVQPGSPLVVAVAQVLPNGAGFGVAIYDNGVERPNTVNGIGVRVNHLQFSQSPSTLYATDSVGNFRRLSVTSSGVSQVDVLSSNLLPGDTKSMVFDAGLVYLSYGVIVNPTPTPPAVTQPFVIPPLDQPRTLFMVRPDSSVGRVLCIGSPNITNLQTRLYSFDQATQQLIGWIDLDAAQGTPIRLIRWGTNGLALNSDHIPVLIIRSTLVSNQ